MVTLLHMLFLLTVQSEKLAARYHLVRILTVAGLLAEIALYIGTR